MAHFFTFLSSKFREGALFIILIFFAVTVSLSNSLSSSFNEGVLLWFSQVLPALFPYALIITLLSGLNITNRLGKRLTPLSRKLFNVNGNVFYALFMGMLTGHPTGVKVVCDLTRLGVLSNVEGVRASALCSTSSPVFLISCIGNITFKNSLFGVLLFLSNLLSTLIVGWFFRFYKRGEIEDYSLASPLSPICFSDGITSSVISVLSVGGFIVFFYMLTDILYSLGILTPLIKGLTQFIGDEKTASAIVFGMFETTKGFKLLSGAKITFSTLPICALLTGFSGISTICQSVSLLKKAKIKTAPFILSKILGAVSCAIFGFVFSLFFFG